MTSEQCLELCNVRRPKLSEIFAGASPVALESIANYRYNGISLGLPGWVERLSWKKFCKDFIRKSDGSVHGWNVRVEQDGLQSPWQPQQRRGKEWRFGPFGVRTACTSPHLEIDYSHGTSGFSPLRLLRDPLRSLDASGDILLGRSLVDVGGGRRLSTPSWFVLERATATS